MVSVCRWILLPFACVVAWHVALIMGALCLDFVHSSYAPEDRETGGFLSLPRYQVVEKVFLTAFTGLSAVFVVATAFFVAPAVRRETAWLAFSVGACVALWFAFGTSEWPAFLAALVAGSVTVLALNSSRFAKRRPTEP